MPCNDGREQFFDKALSDHHKRVEGLLESLLKDPLVPQRHRDAFAAEKARYERAFNLAMDGRYEDGTGSKPWPR
jgi:hypothetical protein